ncbi:MAG: gamma-glutamyltransferase [Polyangiaceae bacterium]
MCGRFARLACATLLFACTHAPAPEQKPRAATSGIAAAASVASVSTASAGPSASPSAAHEIPKPPPPVPFTGGVHAVRGDNGLVVAVEAQAARVGAEVLSAGGNAVDAAVATVFALCVTHQSAASLGGGGFALVRPRESATLAFDFREAAPSGLERKAFEQMLAQGARGKDAVGVPGVVAGLAALTTRLGTRPLSALIAPALELARSGFLPGKWEAELFRMSQATLSRDPSAGAAFFKGGKPPPAGKRLLQPQLARSLEALSKAGPDAFYKGAIAERLARALAPHGPSREDLAQYRCIEREPLSIEYHAYTVQTMPPPSAGGVALIGTLLALADAHAPAPAGSLEATHYLLEAQRRAQAERRLGVVDPDGLSAEARQKQLERWQDARFWLTPPIGPRATPSGELRAAPTEPEREAEHTTHVSVVDRNGMAVSLTTTLSASFGAKLMAPDTGFVLNNAVASFSLSGDNQPRPRARTTSSMAPTLLIAEGHFAVLGTPGGDTIPSTLSQIVTHLVDEHMSLEDAIEAPRWHQSFLPDEARYEPALKSTPWLAELAKLGHRPRALARRFGDANCIIVTSLIAGYADSREPGVSIAAAGR